MIRSFKYILHPDKAQTKVLDNWLRLCRTLYNAALQHRRDAWRMAKKSVSLYDQMKELTEIRQADPEYGAIPSSVVRSSLRRLDRAFQAFLHRLKSGQTPGYPRFQGRDRYNSFSIPFASSEIRGNRVWIPKLGWIKFNRHRPGRGKVLEVHFKRLARRWEVSFVCDIGPAPEKITGGKAVGIDLGLSSFATLSDGTKVENTRFFQKSQTVLTRRQRSLAKKKRGSKSRQRAKLLVARAYVHIRNQRTDFSRKLASDLFKHYNLIAYEDLNVKGMVRGTLAKSIHDVAWSEFIRALTSKAEYAGKYAIAVNPRNTTRACSDCGQIVHKDLSERLHACPCGLLLDRDENAARNILALARAPGRGVVVLKPNRDSLRSRVDKSHVGGT